MALMSSAFKYLFSVPGILTQNISEMRIGFLKSPISSSFTDQLKLAQMSSVCGSLRFSLSWLLLKISDVLFELKPEAALCRYKLYDCVWQASEQTPFPLAGTKTFCGFSDRREIWVVLNLTTQLANAG